MRTVRAKCLSRTLRPTQAPRLGGKAKELLDRAITVERIWKQGDPGPDDAKLYASCRDRGPVLKDPRHQHHLDILLLEYIGALGRCADGDYREAVRVELTYRKALMKVLNSGPRLAPVEYFGSAPRTGELTAKPDRIEPGQFGMLREICNETLMRVFDGEQDGPKLELGDKLRCRIEGAFYRCLWDAWGAFQERTGSRAHHVKGLTDYSWKPSAAWAELKAIVGHLRSNEHVAGAEGIVADFTVAWRARSGVCVSREAIRTALYQKRKRGP